MPSFKNHIYFGITASLLGGWLITSYRIVLNQKLLLPLLVVVILGSILPDLDSDESKPLKFALETFSLLCLALYYLSWKDSPYSFVNLAVGLVGTYVIAKYGIGFLVRKLTHHRGMFHSIPAMFIATLISVVIFSYFNFPGEDALFLSAALGLGYFSHLLLDQLANLTGRRNLFWGHRQTHPRALKFFSRSKKATAVAYIILILLAYSTLPLLGSYWHAVR